MTTMQDVAFDLLVVEELHDAVQCEWKGTPCERSAHWSLVCPQCTDVLLVCTPHRARLDELLRVALGIECDECDHAWRRVFPWSAL